MISLTVEHYRMDAALDGMRAALIGAGKDVQMLLISEHKRLTAMIVNFVAPPKVAGNPQEVGELAVKKDLYSLISEADEHTLLNIESKYGTKDIQTYLTGADGDKIEVNWENIAAGQQIADLHNAYRNNKGRVPRIRTAKGKWSARVVVLKGARDEYVAAVQQRVGRMKAKVAYAASLLGARFPAYIARHFSNIQSEAVAEFNLSSSTPGTDSITFGGRGRGFGQTREAFNAASRIRSKMMARRVQYLAKGYADDIKAGQIPRQHAAETDNEVVESTE